MLLETLGSTRDQRSLLICYVGFTIALTSNQSNTVYLHRSQHA